MPTATPSPTAPPTCRRASALNAATGVVCGTLRPSSFGTYCGRSDRSATASLTDTENFTWTVTNINGPPTLSQFRESVARPSANTTVAMQLAGTDPDGTTLTYSATDLPAGSSINTSTGLVCGTLSATRASAPHTSLPRQFPMAR